MEISFAPWINGYFCIQRLIFERRTNFGTSDPSTTNWNIFDMVRRRRFYNPRSSISGIILILESVLCPLLTDTRIQNPWKMNSNFCNDGSIKLPVTGTKKPINEIIVDPLTMWNVLKPSNLPDYLSLCYGISDEEHENNSKSGTGLKNSCHYGVLDDEGRVTQTHFFSPVYERYLRSVELWLKENASA